MDVKTKVVLKEIISLFSTEIIYDVKKFRAIMRDYCVPRIDVNLLIEIMSASSFQSFICDKNKYNDYEKKKLINELASDYPIERELLEKGVDCFLFAFGIIDVVPISDENNGDDEENRLIANVIKQMLLEASYR